MRLRQSPKLSARRARAGSDLLASSLASVPSGQPLPPAGWLSRTTASRQTFRAESESKRVELRPLRPQHALGLPRDHVKHQGVLVGEVVVELRFARAARRHHLIEARAVNAMFVDEIGRGVDDARARRRAAGGQGTGLGF